MMGDYYFIDAHTHLHNPWFENDFSEVILRAKQNKVLKIVNCSSDPDLYNQVLERADNKTVYATLGIQPTFAKDFQTVNKLRQIEKIEKKVVAIGEVGLDYYWEKDMKIRDYQETLFVNAINFANELQLPLVNHSRKAETKSLDLLEKHAEVPVLLHSFEGNLNEIRRALDLEYLITIPTIVNRRKNRRKVVLRAGVENVMLETDAPFCSHDKSIERNEPFYIPNAAAYIADLLELELQEVANITSKNAEVFYQL